MAKDSAFFQGCPLVGGGCVQIVFILPILVEILVPFLAKSLLRQVLQRISFWPELGDI